MSDSAIKGRSSAAGRKSKFEPTIFGRYSLVEKISKGGMADIYLAKTVNVGGFQKPLVIKRLRPEYSKQPRFVKRFMNEGNTLARLNHANIVQAMDMGVIDGEYYIALEYVEGRNAAHILSKANKAGKLPPFAFSMHVIMELAHGLAYAHRKRGAEGQSLMLVHQDINSFNVMVSFEAEVKIIDFGIARIFLDGPPTKGLPVAGKLIYFSPEQLQNAPVDRRVDIYGAGVLLFEMIAGERLIKHQETVNDTVKTILEMDINKKVGEHPRIDDDLKPLLIKSMASNPNDRYSRMEDMIKDMRKIVTKRGIYLERAKFAKYQKTLFQREIVTDRRRMRKLLAAESPRIETGSPDSASAENLFAEGETNLATEFASRAASEGGEKGHNQSRKSRPLPRTLVVQGGRHIFEQGDWGTDLYVVQKGKVRLFVKVGDRRQVIGIVEEGDVFGETALLDSPRRSSFSEAVEESTLMIIPKAAFARMIPEDLALKVIVRLVERLRESHGVLESRMFEDPLARLIHALIFLHRKAGLQNGGAIEMGPLADLFGLEEGEALKKYLDKLATLRILDAEGETIRMKDSERLSNLLAILTTRGKLVLKL
jgi:serine/threonine protein kinase